MGAAERRRIADPAERFHLSYVVDAETGCWLWTAAIAGNGYATIDDRGRTVLAHRFAYELLVAPIDEGLEVDHVHARGCRHKHCVNPSHLEAVTHRENVLRAKALVTHCRKGHLYDEDNTCWRSGRYGRECRACNRERVAAAKRARRVAA